MIPHSTRRVGSSRLTRHVVMLRLAGRPYLASIANLELLKELRKHASVLGMDTKWDFLCFHLPVIVATFADAAGRGQLGFLSLASAENKEIVDLLLSLLIHNVPCSDPNCKHESQLHVFDGAFGWCDRCVVRLSDQCIFEGTAPGRVRCATRSGRASCTTRRTPTSLRWPSTTC